MKMKSLALTFIMMIFMLVSCRQSQAGGEKDPGSNGDDKKEVVCFVYHRFGDDRYPSTNTPPDIFEKHLKFLKESSFRVMTMGEALTYLDSREAPFYPAVAVITVDDGYKTFLTGAMPLLRKFGFKATLFVNTESVGGGSYLNWEELKALSREGIEIGNHSHAHTYFLDISGPERLHRFKADLDISRSLFKKHLGLDPDLYAYPYGEFDREMEKTLASEGFRAALAQNSGVIYSGSDRYALPRFPAAGIYGRMDRFREKARMKALRITKTRPVSHELRHPDNPALYLTIDKDLPVSWKEIQCFIGGSASEVHIEKTDPVPVVWIQAEKPFRSRRTLYTVTVPSVDHRHWYWYSYPWFCPSCK